MTAICSIKLDLKIHFLSKILEVAVINRYFYYLALAYSLLPVIAMDEEKALIPLRESSCIVISILENRGLAKRRVLSAAK